MQVDMCYLKICGSGGHVSHENICCGRICPVGGQVWLICAEAATIEAAVSLICWVFFLQYIFFIFETCFPRNYCLKCSFGYVGLLLWSAWVFKKNKKS